VYLSDSRVTNISKSFTHKKEAKISLYRYVTKLRHCHPMYSMNSYHIMNNYAYVKCKSVHNVNFH